MPGANTEPSSQVVASQGLAGIQLDQHGFGQSQNQPGGAYHAFDFAKYGTRYLGAFFIGLTGASILMVLPLRLLVAVVTIGPRPAYWLSQAEASC